MKRVWTARSLAAVLGGSLLYFLITVLVMMCGSFSPLFWVFLPAITAAASGWLYLYLAARTPRFGVPVLMNLVVLLLFLAAGELSGWNFPVLFSFCTSFPPYSDTAHAFLIWTRA